MKNLAILFIGLLFMNTLNAQRWNSAFLGKPESRALYASNVAKAIQNAWEVELSLKGKKEMLLDEIIFGQEVELKDTNNTDTAKSLMNNIDEIEEVLGIKEETIIVPVRKKKIENSPVISNTGVTVSESLSENANETKKLIENERIKTLETDDYLVRKSSLLITNDEIEIDSVYSIPQVSPMFSGGHNAMKNFFAQNIKMPESKGQVIKGKVFVRFMVKKNGELVKIYLIKGLTDDCNKEALRVVRKMPFWIPAKQEGENVNSWYTLPIYFEID